MQDLELGNKSNTKKNDKLTSKTSSKIFKSSEKFSEKSKSNSHKELLENILQQYQNQSEKFSKDLFNQWLPPIPTEQEFKRKKALKDVPTLLLNADLLVKFHEEELASHLVRKALYLDSYHVEALKKLALHFKNKKKFDLVSKIYEKLLTVEYGFENVVNIAHNYYQLGKDEIALEKYHEALTLISEETPELFNIFKNIGNIYVKLQDFEAAEEYYNKAFTLQCQSDVLMVNFGTLEVQREDYNSALMRFRSAIELNPKNDKAWVGLALVHKKMGDHILSQANIENALDINPLNKTALHLFAHWASDSKKMEEAIVFIQNYLAATDFDHEMSLILIHLFFASKKWEFALLEIERFLLWEPTNEEILNLEKSIEEHRKNEINKSY